LIKHQLDRNPGIKTRQDDRLWILDVSGVRYPFLNLWVANLAGYVTGVAVHEIREDLVRRERRLLLLCHLCIRHRYKGENKCGYYRELPILRFHSSFDCPFSRRLGFQFALKSFLEILAKGL